MRVLIICVATIVLTTTTDVVDGQYRRVSNGWIRKHRVMATWDEARDQCQREGAVLASPITPELRNEMKSMVLSQNKLYFTGIRTSDSKINFQSVEGVLLDQMPVSAMFELLNPDEGQCLAMNSDFIKVVPCSSRLPYMCYKNIQTNKTPNIFTLNDLCSTNDTDVANRRSQKTRALSTADEAYEQCKRGGYKYFNSTGSCYKLHNERTSWNDAFPICNAEGGYLAIINDVNEASVLTREIFISKAYYVWIGLIKCNAAEKWKTIHGQPFDELYHEGIVDVIKKTPWCAAVHPTNGVIEYFDDCIAPSILRPFVCEKNLPPIVDPLQIYDITSTKNRT